jgi:hypothetical protein
METRQLLIFCYHILNIRNLELSGLCNFPLLRCRDTLIIIFLFIVHCTTYFILVFKNFDLSVFTPDH